MQVQSKKQKKAILQQFKFNPQRIKKLTEILFIFCEKITILHAHKPMLNWQPMKVVPVNLIFAQLFSAILNNNTNIFKVISFL